MARQLRGMREIQERERKKKGKGREDAIPLSREQHVMAHRDAVSILHVSQRTLNLQKYYSVDLYIPVDLYVPMALGCIQSPRELNEGIPEIV
ncbi:hypothetical protein STEG23_001187 [Scotinomys teguina]